VDVDDFANWSLSDIENFYEVKDPTQIGDDDFDSVLDALGMDWDSLWDLVDYEEYNDLEPLGWYHG
jgi:hypothetical protein